MNSKIFSRTKLLAALCIWTIIVLMFWLWYFKIFDSINTTHILDSKDALSRISLLKHHLSYYLFPLFFLPTCIIWIVSFWKKLIKVFLVIFAVGVVIGFFLILYGFALGSGCQGLGCIGAGIPLFFGLFVLSISAFSFPFVFILLKNFASPAFIRTVSASLLIVVSLLGMIFFEISSKALKIAGKENPVKRAIEWSNIILFEPTYVTPGLHKKEDRIDYKSHQYLQSYEAPRFEDYYDHVRITETKAQKSFANYYKEYKNQYEEKPLGAGKWTGGKIVIDGLETGIWSFQPETTPPTQWVILLFIKDGILIEISSGCHNLCQDAKKEAIAIAEFLRPKNKPFGSQPAF